VAHSEAVWDQPIKESIQAWQPEEASPIVGILSSKIRELVRAQRSREV
jgi:hypothetical protein